MIQAAKIIGTGLATTGLIGAGIGIGLATTGLIGLGIGVLSILTIWLILNILYVKSVEGKSVYKYLQFLLNRAFLSLEWCLNSPPKPYAFTTLQVRSHFSIPFELIPWYEICSTLNPQNLTWIAHLLCWSIDHISVHLNAVTFMDLYKFISSGALHLSGSIDYTKVFSVLLKSMNAYMPFNLMADNPIIWFSHNGIGHYGMLTSMLNDIPDDVKIKLIPMLIKSS